MARTDLTVQQISRVGLDPVLTEAFNTPDGEQFENNGNVWFHIQNDNAGTIVATFLIPGLVDGVAVVNGGKQVTAILTGEDRFIGPFPTTTYNQSDGKVYVDISPGTSVFVSAFRL